MQINEVKVTLQADGILEFRGSKLPGYRQAALQPPDAPCRALDTDTYGDELRAQGVTFTSGSLQSWIFPTLDNSLLPFFQDLSTLTKASVVWVTEKGRTTYEMGDAKDFLTFLTIARKLQAVLEDT